MLVTASPAPLTIAKSYGSPGPRSPALEEDRAEGLMASKQAQDSPRTKDFLAVPNSTRNSTMEDGQGVQSSGQKESVQSFSSRSAKMKLIKLRPTPQAEDFADHFSRAGQDNYLVTIEDEDVLYGHDGVTGSGLLNKHLLEQIDEVPTGNFTLLRPRKKSPPAQLKTSPPKRVSNKRQLKKKTTTPSLASGPVTRSSRTLRPKRAKGGFRTPRPFEQP